MIPFGGAIFLKITNFCRLFAVLQSHYDLSVGNSIELLHRMQTLTQTLRFTPAAAVGRRLLGNRGKPCDYKVCSILLLLLLLLLTAVR